MRINWKVRLRNKTWLMTFILSILAIVYKVAELFGFAIPDYTEVESIVEMVVGILVLLGVVIDPTTKGIEDSERALGYDEPN